MSRADWASAEWRASREESRDARAPEISAKFRAWAEGLGSARLGDYIRSDPHFLDSLLPNDRRAVLAMAGQISIFVRGKEVSLRSIVADLKAAPLPVGAPLSTIAAQLDYGAELLAALDDAMIDGSSAEIRRVVAMVGERMSALRQLARWHPTICAPSSYEALIEALDVAIGAGRPDLVDMHAADLRPADAAALATAIEAESADQAARKKQTEDALFSRSASLYQALIALPLPSRAAMLPPLRPLLDEAHLAQIAATGAPASAKHVPPQVWSADTLAAPKPATPSPTPTKADLDEKARIQRLIKQSMKGPWYMSPKYYPSYMAFCKARPMLLRILTGLFAIAILIYLMR